MTVREEAIHLIATLTDKQAEFVLGITQAPDKQGMLEFITAHIPEASPEREHLIAHACEFHGWEV